MADVNYTVDFSEIDALTASFTEIGDNAGPFVRSAVEHSSVEVMKDWRDSTSGLEHAPAFPFSISYDVVVFQGFGVSVIRADIGPDKDRTQGALGNLLEFGSVNNPPRGDGHGALQRAEEDYQRGLDQAIQDAEAQAGFGGAVRNVVNGGRW